MSSLARQSPGDLAAVDSGALIKINRNPLHDTKTTYIIYPIFRIGIVDTSFALRHIYTKRTMAGIRHSECERLCSICLRSDSLWSGTINQVRAQCGQNLLTFHYSLFMPVYLNASSTKNQEQDHISSYTVYYILTEYGMSTISNFIMFDSEHRICGERFRMQTFGANRRTNGWVTNTNANARTFTFAVRSFNVYAPLHLTRKHTEVISHRFSRVFDMLQNS